VSDKIAKILRSSNNPCLVCMGRLFANFVSMPVLEELFKRIDLAAESAKKNGFEQLVENDTLILAFATEPNDHTLRTWAIQNGVVDSERQLPNPSTSSFIGHKYEIEESYRIKQRIKNKKGQFDRKNLNILVIKDDHFFGTAVSIPKYFGMVEQFVYERDYLAMLIIVGGHARQKMVNDLAIENIFKRDNHLYLLQGINQSVREILIVTNNYSLDNQRTLDLSSRIQTAFKTCQTLLS
jgi:hypothetical protein